MTSIQKTFVTTLGALGLVLAVSGAANATTSQDLKERIKALEERVTTIEEIARPSLSGPSSEAAWPAVDQSVDSDDDWIARYREYRARYAN